MRTYKIERTNGDRATAHSLKDALAASRRMLGVTRVYRGAEYQTDRPGKDDEREYCTGLDIWTSPAEAKRQSDAPAPVVISW
jgi:hypothetical protein